MKIKKTLLATVLFGCVLSGSAFAEKVTYDKAVADAKAYHDSLPQYEKAIDGLDVGETGGTTASANQMGKWVNVGAVNYQTGGSVILSPSSYGQKCIKGMIGFVPTGVVKQIMTTKTGHSGTTQILMDSPDYRRGNKVECR